MERETDQAIKVVAEMKAWSDNLWKNAKRATRFSDDGVTADAAGQIASAVEKWSASILAAISPQREDTGEGQIGHLRIIDEAGDITPEQIAAILTKRPPAPTEGVERAVPSREDMELLTALTADYRLSTEKRAALRRLLVLVEGRSA